MSEAKQNQHNGTVNQSVLEDIVRRVVEVASPLKIILFGSAARNEMHRDSDIDLLVIAETKHRRDLAGRIYGNLWGVGSSVDVVVVTPCDIEQYGDSNGLVLQPALQDGRVVYESPKAKQ